MLAASCIFPVICEKSEKYSSSRGNKLNAMFSILQSGIRQRCAAYSVTLAMLDKYRLTKINVQLANIFYIIADALEIFRDEQQSRRSICGLGLSDHQLDQLPKYPVIMFVDHSIAADYLPRCFGVLGGKCIQGLS